MSSEDFPLTFLGNVIFGTVDINMAISTRPILVIHVAWHPDFADGATIAKALYEHYHRQLYENVAGGAGLSVTYRSTPAPGSDVPIDIDFTEAETTAVVVLIDEKWVAHPSWVKWGQSLMNRADTDGLHERVFPVAIDKAALTIPMAEQAVRWDGWTDAEQEERIRRLIANLTYQCCRILRHYLERLKHPRDDDEALQKYLQKVEVFISHSKHDTYGAPIAKLIRKCIFEGKADTLGSFFDVYDIPAGLRFNKVLLEKVRVSAVVAIHTDSYSSREWCRREVLEAKRHNVPLVVADCINDVDERSFPYMGNVPVVRMDPSAADRIDYIVSRLLDEVLKDFLWRIRIQLAGAAHDDIVFLPRPPELISLANLHDSKVTLVYPDPPIGSEERGLFDIVAPTVRLRSITEWLAESTV